MNIIFEETICSAVPELQVIVVEATVENHETDDDLWAELSEAGNRIRDTYEMSMINKRPGIAGTRDAYKALGKEPNRYRPSTEALCRRMVKGAGLYRSLSLIDMINLISVLSGHSIGGFDADKIDGDTLTLGVGREGEPYEAIGRGTLNIAHLPVFRDNTGGIGTPTSDNERTKLTAATRHLLMTINIYREDMPQQEIIGMTTSLLERYAGASDIKVSLHKVLR